MSFQPGVKISFERGIGAATSDATVTNDAARALLAMLDAARRPDLEPVREALEWTLGQTGLIVASLLGVRYPDPLGPGERIVDGERRYSAAWL